MKKQKKNNRQSSRFENLASAVTRATGSTAAFLIAMAVVIVWVVTGPVFHYSDTWQLVINTGTTIVTFLMVFLIQKTQNKDSIAMQLKLNELIAANEKASNRLISVEDLTEEELHDLKEFYCLLTDLAKKQKDLLSSHSIEEAEENHSAKMKRLLKKIKADDVAG